MSPNQIQQINWKPWVLGLLWTVSIPLLPVAEIVFEQRFTGSRQINWQLVWHQAVLLGGAALTAYWRKYKALLQLPPILEEAKKLQQGVKVTTTTTATVTQETTTEKK